MDSYSFDVLIIGTGISGLSSAIKLAESGMSVGIVTKEENPNETNTYYAQGGIIYSEPNDHKLVSDIDSASSYTTNKNAANILLNRSGEILSDILLNKVKTNFSRDNSGNLKFTREAAHSLDRIIYQGDFTGKEIQISLLNYINNKERFPNVSIIMNHTAIDLLTPLHHGMGLQQRYEENKVVGAYLLNQKTKDVIKVIARKTILATGGIGALYLHHSNSEGARGDGHAMARRAGAQLINMEFVQFHPTTFYDSSSGRRFLISEAVRGEGGVLINSKGNCFMQEYHPAKELAPRDVVARGIAGEMIKSKHECAYLDISSKNKDWIQERFPTIFNHCLKNNIDISQNPIPVVPSAHYSCGGVKTDLKGKTTLQNLYAVGEVACNGLHGANRLASTSLLEGLTWGHIAAEDILRDDKNNLLDERYPAQKIRDWETCSGESDVALIEQDWQTLKQTMWNYVGLIRTANRLDRASSMFRELLIQTEVFYKGARLRDSLIGLRNALEVGIYVLNSSRRNKESTGCFFRKN
jgi:L-aspartate oxidase